MSMDREPKGRFRSTQSVKRDLERTMSTTVLQVTKLRADRTASRLAAGRATTATATVSDPCHTEHIVLTDDCFTIDSQQAPVDVVMTTDPLLSNGMTPLSPRALSESDEENEVKRSSVGNALFYDQFAHVATSHGYSRHQPQLDGVRLSRRPADLVEDESVDGGEILPGTDGRTSDEQRDHVTDYIRNEMTAQDVGWMEDSKSTEVTPLMMEDNLSNCDVAPDIHQLETAASNICGQSLVASTEINSSASSSSSSLLSVLCEVLSDDDVTTAASNHVDAASSSDTAPENGVPSTSDHDDRVSLTSSDDDDDDNYRRRLAAAESTSPLSAAAARDDVTRSRLADDRSHQHDTLTTSLYAGALSGDVDSAAASRRL